MNWEVNTMELFSIQHALANNLKTVLYCGTLCQAQTKDMFSFSVRSNVTAAGCMSSAVPSPCSTSNQ